MDLFAAAGEEQAMAKAPLAVRMPPVPRRVRRATTGRRSRILASPCDLGDRPCR